MNPTGRGSLRVLVSMSVDNPHGRGDAEIHFLRNAPIRLAFLMESDHLGRFPV
jgi:hypothetical protein